MRRKINELDEQLTPFRAQHAALSVELELAAARFDLPATTELLPQVNALTLLLARGREQDAQLQAELSATEVVEQRGAIKVWRAAQDGDRTRLSALNEARSLKRQGAQMRFNREAAGNTSASGLAHWDETWSGELQRIETRLAALVRQHSLTDWELDQPV